MPQTRELYSTIYSAARGNWDMFVVFVEQGCRLVSPTGVFSFIIPNKILAAKYADKIRELLAQNRIIEIRDYSRVNVFEEAAVYPCTIVKKNGNCFSESDSTRFTTMSDKTSIASSVVTQSLSLQQFSYWDVFFNDKQTVNRILKMYSNVKIGELAGLEVLGAATVAEAYVVKEKIFDEEHAKGTFKLVNTGTIDPYHSLWGEYAMQYIKGRYMFPRVFQKDVREMSLTRFNQAINPKIIVAGMSNRIEAFLDMGETLAGKSTTILVSSDLKTLKVLLAVLNSDIISWYMNLLFNSLKMAGGYLNYGVREISAVPIPLLSDSEKNTLIRYVDKILSFNDYCNKLPIIEKIDILVKKAFFR